MNATEYKKAVLNTLNSSDVQSVEDFLSVLGKICNKLGVAFPKGKNREVQKALNNGECMGWECCTEEEAQQRANNGTPVLGMTDETVTMILPEDTEEEMEEDVVSEYASTTSEFPGTSRSSMQYYSYSLPTTTTTAPVVYPNIIHVGSIRINDTSMILVVGQTVKPTTLVVPLNATNRSLQWISSRSDIVSVNSDGMIVANKPGTARIIAISLDGSGASAYFDVLVENKPTVTVISCSPEAWKTSSETMGADMAAEYKQNYANHVVETPINKNEFEDCWYNSAECIIVHTHGDSDGLYNEANGSTPLIISKDDISRMNQNERIFFVLVIASGTADGVPDDNVAYWLSKKINSKGIVIANTNTVVDRDTYLCGESKKMTWKVLRNGDIIDTFDDVQLTMDSAYKFYQSHK